MFFVPVMITSIKGILAQTNVKHLIQFDCLKCRPATDKPYLLYLSLAGDAIGSNQPNQKTGFLAKKRLEVCVLKQQSLQNSPFKDNRKVQVKKASD